MSHTLAILFEKDVETSARCVLDIIRVEGVDRNARRRLRRAILNRHGYSDRWSYAAVTYETYGPDGMRAADVTHRFLPPSKESPPNG